MDQVDLPTEFPSGGDSDTQEEFGHGTVGDRREQPLATSYHQGLYIYFLTEFFPSPAISITNSMLQMRKDFQNLSRERTRYY